MDASLGPEDSDYLDELEDISEGYETELNALAEGLNTLNESGSSTGAIGVATRIKALGERARSLEPSDVFLDSHGVFLEGVAEFDVAMEELIALAEGDKSRAESAPDVVGTHLESGIRLIEQSTSILNRLIVD